MGKRKGRKQPQIPATEEEITQNDEQGKKGSGFFACYLLTSLCPRFKGHTYIGYTLNPRRRIRQHNGQIGSGACRTKRKRPWEMVLCIYGFTTNIAALQFEWAWQHPVESLAVRKAAASFKSLSGLGNKIKLAYTMLTLPPWQSLNLTVNLFSTKYQHYTSACVALPKQMRMQVCSMDELPCYNENSCIHDELDDIACDGNSQEFEHRDYIPEENVNQELNRTDGACLQSSRCSSSPVREDDEWRFCFSNTTTFPSSSSCINEEMESPRLVELTTEPLNQQTSTMVADKLIKNHDISIPPQVEIIDIFTPSPVLEKSGSKKRRPNMWPEVIDLTNSPIYV